MPRYAQKGRLPIAAGLRKRSRPLTRLLLVSAIFASLLAPSTGAEAVDNVYSVCIVPDCRVKTPAVPHVKVNFSAVALPMIAPAGVTVAYNEECRHLNFTRTTNNQGGGKLYDFSLYLAWCADKKTHVITRVLDHACRTTPHQTWLGYDSPCQYKWNATPYPQGGRTSLGLYDEWHLWAHQCCWNYRPLIDAQFTGNWSFTGSYYYW